MKKILYIFVLLSILTYSVFAEVLPYYVNSLKRYGIGYTSVVSPVVLRQAPSLDGQIIEVLNFDYNRNFSCQINKQRCELENVFSAYSETNKIALLTTLDESEDWSLVCFNQAQNPICGWVKEDKNKFYNWSDFFEIYGKKYGLYLLKDVQKQDKVLYSAPFKQTNSTGQIQLAKSISPWLVRGNWVLVKVIDLDNQAKTGWINYRGENGKLKLFVKF